MKDLLRTLILATPIIGASAQCFDCPVTIASSDKSLEPWVQSDSQSDWEGGGAFTWYGTDELAALIPTDGNWLGMGPERDYFNKFWWWRKGYDARTASKSALKIVATRLDKHSDPVQINDTTSGYNSSGWNAMLVGMTFPSGGCWKVDGSYEGHQLTVVFNVGSNR